MTKNSSAGTPFRFSLLTFMALVAITLSLTPITAAAAEYYVDAGYGQDSNDGSADRPWRTLTKAWTEAPSGSTVLVRSGTYDGLSISSPRSNLTDYITFRAAEGQRATVDGVSVDFGSPANAYLRIVGLDIIKDGSRAVVNLKNARHFQVIDSKIHAKKWAVSGVGVTGVYVVSSADILVQGSAMYEIHRGLSISNSENVTVRNNYIQAKAGTGIQYAGGNYGGLIEANHIKGVDYVPYPDDPDAVQGPHASIISVRSSDLTIRRNLLHGMGNSSGIMFYDRSGEDFYSNITIENNAIYDTDNSYGLRIYNLGTNVNIVNNLIHSRYRSGDCSGVISDARYRYNTALAVHSLAPGYDGSGLRVFNNILIGNVSLPDNVQESNNVIWSWYGGSGSGWLDNAPGSSSSVIVASSSAGCGSHPRFFEDGTFFEAAVDFTALDGQVPNFRLAASSIGNNFGDSSKQATRSLGTVGTDGFLRNDGVTRSSTIHNVGPYESLQEIQLAPPSAPVLSVQ